MDEGNKRSNIHLVVGDFNARIVETAPRERTAIGPHHLKQDGNGINTLSTNQKDNRNRLVEFAIANTLSITNTWYIQRQKELITFRVVWTKDFNDAITMDRYAQMDYIMAPNYGKIRSQTYTQQTKQQ